MSLKLSEAFVIPIPGKYSTYYYDMFPYEPESVGYMVCNFRCCVETEWLFKVTCSHVQCKSGGISETIQDGDVVTAEYRLLGYEEVIYGPPNSAISIDFELH